MFTVLPDWLKREGEIPQWDLDFIVTSQIKLMSLVVVKPCSKPPTTVHGKWFRRVTGKDVPLPAYVLKIPTATLL